ncbi:flagellin [Sporosarcina soli]|uniref:Flagellin n=1 Tax=Sporosarcina soli TaxID=334736 RepID=A0ABW0TJX7_9BACL
MRINHNIAALNTHRQLGINNTGASKNLEKLSSGLKINRAGDDAAGLAISEKMRGQIRGLDMAQKNSQDGISLIQTAEGALNETHSILQRMRELAVQSSNDTNTGVDRGEIQKEIDQLTAEIDRIGNTTEFNTQKLLNGDRVGLSAAKKGTASIQNNSRGDVDFKAATMSLVEALTAGGTITITRINDATGVDQFIVSDAANSGINLDDLGTAATGITVGGVDLSIANLLDIGVGESVTITINAKEDAQTDASKSVSLQIGANTGQNILVGINDMRATALGVRATSGESLDVSDSGKASTAVTVINNAIEKVSAERSKLGATQNRLEHTINNLGAASENLTAAESRIRDVDMAAEMMEFTKNNILTQAAQAMLAQANQQPQGVLQLLR